MSKNKHTPGPWVINGRYIVGQDSETVCDPFDFATEKSAQEKNAHLIAAAPEMLEALESITYHLTELNSEDKLKGLGLDLLIKQCFDLTEKAKGGA